MKKITLVFAILLLSAGLSYGQFTFGPKIGYNASQLHSSMSSIKTSFNSGFHFGAFFRIGKKVYLQPELYYTSQSGLFQTDLVNPDSNWKQKVTLGTLDIPVLIGFNLINLKVVNWRIMAGPMASFVVNSNIKDFNSVSGPIKNADIKKVNWYVQVGTGVDVLFLTLDIRYQIGLNQVISSATSIAKGTTPAHTYNLNATNKMWVVSLGFKI